MSENASTALLMAGGLLISVLILTAGVFAFRSSANFAQNYEENVEESVLRMFNEKFEVYEGKALTMQDVISIANMAHDINEKKDGYNITVVLRDKGINLEKYKRTDLIKLMNDIDYGYPGSGKSETELYECKVGYGDDNNKNGIHRVNKVTIYKSNDKKIITSDEYQMDIK